MKRPCSPTDDEFPSVRRPQMPSTDYRLDQHAVVWIVVRHCEGPPARRFDGGGATENEEFNLLKKTNEWILNSVKQGS